MSSASPPAPATADEAHLRGDARRIESLLDELGDLVALPAYQRVEELVQRLLRLHGAGLGRLVDIALDRSSTRDRGGAARGAVQRICDDPLLSSLLLMHGLHPQPAEERIRAALARLGRYSGWRVELAHLDDAGIARLRVTSAGPPDQRPLIETAVMDAAPELSGVTVDNPGSDLVQIDVRRSRSRERR